MLQLVTTTKFRKDYKRIKKRGYDLSQLEKVINTLLYEEPLEQKYRDHARVMNNQKIIISYVLTFSYKRL